MTQLTRAQVERYLSHPDALVRSHADWTREYRGWGWRRSTLYWPQTADVFEAQLISRLEALSNAGLEHSAAYHIKVTAS